EWIDRNLSHVTPADQIVERLRQASFVGCKLIDQAAHRAEILLQHCLTRMHNRFLILRQCDGSQNDDDRDHDHQLQQRKPRYLHFTSHRNSPHLKPCLSNWTERQKHSLRPTNHNAEDRKPSITSNPTYPS